MDEPIRFYAVGDEYGCFSNFSPHPITLRGQTWPTSEHYFQAQKFAGTPDEDEVRQAKSPMIAARMGRSRKRPLRRDWESVKDSIMHEAVLAKFTQHDDLRVTVGSRIAARSLDRVGGIFEGTKPRFVPSFFSGRR